MEVSIIIICALLTCVAVDMPAEKEHYSDEYDDFDVEAVLNNKRLFNYYLNCFRTGRNCPMQAQNLREIILDALKTDCGRCTETQIKKGRVVFDFILKNHPELFLEFERKYDAERVFRKKYAARLKEEGFVLPN